MLRELELKLKPCPIDEFNGGGANDGPVIKGKKLSSRECVLLPGKDGEKKGSFAKNGSERNSLKNWLKRSNGSVKPKGSNEAEGPLKRGLGGDR